MHKTIVCRCGVVLSTCRCPAPNKPKVISDKPCTHEAVQVNAEESSDPLEMPVSHITDGWTLLDGCLYLFVACADGVTRTTIIERSNCSGRYHNGNG